MRTTRIPLSFHSYICVIPSEAEGPRIFLDAKQFGFT